MAAAEGNCAAAPWSGVRTGGAVEVAATGGDSMATHTSRTRTAGGGATGLVIASGHHTAAPSLRTRTEGVVDLAAAAPLPRTRMEGAVDLAAAAPSLRTRMEGDGGLGHGGHPPRCLPLVGEEDGRRVLPRRKAMARPPPLQA